MVYDQILVELQDTMGSDRAIAEAAWTSSTTLKAKELKTVKDIERVVNMLADLKHSVPFESVIFRFWIRLPIQTDRQHMTHRIGSHSGMSGRYRTMPKEWLHISDDVGDILRKASRSQLIKRYEDLCQETNDFYEATLSILKLEKQNDIITDQEYKRVREFLRGVLPQNNMTERVTILNLRSFANYYKLRSKSDAQPEIQDVANKMLAAVEDKGCCPIALAALRRNNWVI